MSVGTMRDVDREPGVGDALTYREQLFVGSYVLSGCNATEAMRRIGFGGKNPDVSAARYMARPRVQRAIQDRIRASQQAQEVTVERLKARYAEFAFAAYEGTVTPSHCLAALDSLGKHLGMFKPEQVTMAPVTFQFIGGPPLFQDDGSSAKTIEAKLPDRSR